VRRLAVLRNLGNKDKWVVAAFLGGILAFICLGFAVISSKSSQTSNLGTSGDARQGACQVEAYLENKGQKIEGQETDPKMIEFIKYCHNNYPKFYEH